MIDLMMLLLSLALALGLVLGAVFYGGLWWTIRIAAASAQPALWFLGSGLLRMSIVLTGFYFAGRNHWQALLLCLAGFIISRLIVSWMTRSVDQGSQASGRQSGAHHAS